MMKNRENAPTKVSRRVTLVTLVTLTFSFSFKKLTFYRHNNKRFSCVIAIKRVLLFCLSVNLRSTNI